MEAWNKGKKANDDCARPAACGFALAEKRFLPSPSACEREAASGRRGFLTSCSACERESRKRQTVGAPQALAV